MRRTPALVVVAGVALLLVAVAVLALGTSSGPPDADGESSTGPQAAAPTPTPRPTARPKPGHEIYGYVPYWEMDEDIADHVAQQDLSTLALFSVTARRNGTLNDTARGYRRITDDIGRRLIREARDRGVRVELVFSSFGAARNERLFGGSVATQDKVIGNLASFVKEHHLDGVNVDVEVLDRELIPAYAGFVERLQDRLRADDPDAQVSVATGANVVGSEMAAAAAQAGADRIFLMGYDYHWSGSAPGASAPLVRRDGDEKDLAWSLDRYEALGVPVERTLLGLPLYGMTWPVDGPGIGAGRTGRGTAWVPSNNRGFLRRPPVEPVRDEIEVVDVYVIPPEGVDPDAPTATPDLAAGAGATPEPVGGGGWRAIYVDSPETLVPKLRLANDRGLAGAGFWAIGFERGLPGYQKLIDDFRRDELPSP